MLLGQLVMVQLAVAFAVFTTLLTHYVFCFQRFTLEIARRYTQAVGDVSEIQMLMTPPRMGTLGWACHAFTVVAAILLGIAFAWWVGVVYFVLELFLIGSLLPLLPLKNHFAGLARAELRRQTYSINAPLVLDLIAEVDRAEYDELA